MVASSPQGSISSSPQGWRCSAGASPKPSIFKRVPSTSSISSMVQSTHVPPFRRRSTSLPAPDRTSLVGRKISVPYSLIIEDDYSGCTCECYVLEKSMSRGYLVTLAGEQLWKPESFIRRWLCGQVEAEALNELLATVDLSSGIPPVPLTGATAELLSRGPTSLVPLDTGDTSLGGGAMQLETGGAATDLMQNAGL